MTVKVTVFASSRETNPLFIEASHDLGRVLANKGCLCVNGGGQFGCMGALNRGCSHHSGKIRGVIHRKFIVDHGESKLCDELVISEGEDLNERKQLLFDNGDCIIVLPGGIGTFDEFFDAVGAKSLGMKGMGGKPICVINVDGFYDGLILQMERARMEKMLYDSIEDYFHVENNVESAVDWCVANVRDDVKKDNLDSNFSSSSIKQSNSIDVTVDEETTRMKERMTDRSGTQVLSSSPNSSTIIGSHVMFFLTGFIAGILVLRYHK